MKLSKLISLPFLLYNMTNSNTSRHRSAPLGINATESQFLAALPQLKEQMGTIDPSCVDSYYRYACSSTYPTCNTSGGKSVSLKKHNVAAFKLITVFYRQNHSTCRLSLDLSRSGTKLQLAIHSYQQNEPFTRLQSHLTRHQSASPAGRQL